MRGVNWRYLSPSQFACPSHILNNDTLTITHAGSHDCTPRCDVIGSPRPVVTWFRHGQPISDELMETRVVEWREDGEEGGGDAERVVSCVRLVNVTPADAGDFKSVANNSAGR